MITLFFSSSYPAVRTKSALIRQSYFSSSETLEITTILCRYDVIQFFIEIIPFFICFYIIHYKMFPNISDLFLTTFTPEMLNFVCYCRNNRGWYVSTYQIYKISNSLPMIRIISSNFPVK